MSEYTRNELRVLWQLRKHGPYIRKDGLERPTIYDELAGELFITTPSIKYLCRMLEDKSLILRTYLRPKAKSFKDNQGYNPVLRVELVDPNMVLPPCPPPLTLGTILNIENRDLYERTAEEPPMERILTAVLDRNDQLQDQINKLQELINGLVDENDHLKKELAELKRPARSRLSTHLTHRAKDALPPETWDALRHPEPRKETDNDQ